MLPPPPPTKNIKKTQLLNQNLKPLKPKKRKRQENK